MTEPLLATIDLGTTNCKVAVFTLDGRLVAGASAGYPTLAPREGWFEQRPADWRAAIAAASSRVAAELGESAADVAGLTLSAWGPGLVLLDEGGEPLREASPTWQDVRSLEHGRRLVEVAGVDWIGGGLPLTGFAAKLAWALESWPDARGAAFAAGVKDYVLRWLTGSLVTDPSSGPCGLAWPAGAFAAAGWDVSRLPPVRPSTEVVGALLPERAAELGMPPGLPLVNGVNDGAAATLGVGAHRPGDAVVSIGTNGVFRLVTTQPPAPETCLQRSLFRYPLVGELWACGGFVLAGGSALDWLAGAVGEADLELLLREAADAPPGSDGVVFLPYLVGRGSPDPDPGATGAVAGLRRRHRRGHVTRAVLEGVAFGLRDIVAALGELGLGAERLFVTGGGAASPLWRQVLAGVLGLPAAYASGDSNLGAAAVLAVGLGLAEDVSAALVRLVAQPEITPARREYEGAYVAYREVARRLGA